MPRNIEYWFLLIYLSGHSYRFLWDYTYIYLMLKESTQLLLHDLQSVQSDLENLIQFRFDKPVKQLECNLFFHFFFQRQYSDYVNRQTHAQFSTMWALYRFFSILFHFKCGKWVEDLCRFCLNMTLNNETWWQNYW